MYVEFNMTVLATTIEVTGTVIRGAPAQLYGAPELCYPAEDDQVELDVTLINGELTINGDEVEEAIGCIYIFQKGDSEPKLLWEILHEKACQEADQASQQG